MIDKNANDRNRFINGFLIIAAIALLATSIYSVYTAWRVGLAQSRAETASRLMAIRTSPRSTETPGINAWVSWSLLNNNLDESRDVSQRLKQLVIPRTQDNFPDEFRTLLSTLQCEVPEATPSIELLNDSEIGGQPSAAKLEFRKVNYVRNQDQLFVVSSRSDKVTQAGLPEFAAQSSTHLMQIQSRWAQENNFSAFEQLPRLKSARVARFYVLNEDETLISMPLAANSGTTSNQELYLSEGDEFRKNPRSPSFVSNNFFFNFDFDKPLDSQAVFTGMYLDLGGLGLVASVIKPVVYQGKRCALGADVAFEMDWEEFASNLSQNLISHVAHLNSKDSSTWNPWSEFYSNVPESSGELRTAIREMADRSELDGESMPRKSIYLATTRNGEDLIAIQVDRSTWLLLLVAASEIALPWATIVLTSLVFFALLFRIEQSRRKAVAAQKSATNQLQEKQNLLDTMQVPLMVVDPNTDQVVYCNNAAQDIGMSPGAYFGKDIVATDQTAQDQYLRTQTLGEEHRRAYGVPIRVQKDRDREVKNQYAIVRSVAVTAPIAAIQADERHRLGILFLVDEKIDLALLMQQAKFETRQDEKRRLSGLLNHGVDSLARVLAHQANQLGVNAPQDRFEFADWLSRYLSERIQLVSWALENWSGQPAPSEQRIIERSTVVRTLEKYEKVFEVAASDRSLRERLHWNNGPVSSAKNGNTLRTHFDWDEESCFSVPRDGVFGFFLGEVLVNAARHGQVDSAIQFQAIENRNRGEIEFSVRNEAELPVGSDLSKPFGGLAILDELARLSGWQPPHRSQINGEFIIRWSVPVIRRKQANEGD